MAHNGLRALLPLVVVLVAAPLQAAESLHSNPVITTPDGQVLARGEHLQDDAPGRVDTTTTYQFDDGRVVEETVTLSTEPFGQEAFTWVETRDAVTLRRFKVDFTTGEVRAFVDEEGRARHWEERFSLKPGHAFAGSGFVHAVQQIRKEITLGDDAYAQAVAFTPRPRVATVRLTGERATLELDGRVRDAERWVIHPELGVLDLFVDAPDVVIWLDADTGALLAFDGPLLLPDDPTIRIVAGG